MAGTGHNNYGGRALVKDLEAQGFSVEVQGGRYVVKSPDGEGINFFHVSSFDKGVPGIFAELGRMGFKKPKEKVGAAPPKPKRDKKKQPGPFERCRVEACPYPGGKPIHLGRHVQAKIDAGDSAHINAYPERVRGADIPQPPAPERKQRGVTVRHVEPQSPTVRMRNKLQQLQAALAAANEAAEWMMQQYEGMAEENKTLKAKVDKFEKLLGKGLEIL